MLKKIRGIGEVYPCKQCGRYPKWVTTYLHCPNECYETDYDWDKTRPDFRVCIASISEGYSAVEDWNEENK